MSAQMLFYKTAVPVSSGRHARCCVELDGRYGFARRVNSVPLTAVEFPLAAAEYPIVFARMGAEVVPVAVLGARQDENAFVDPQGRWQARYVPAFVRRYPFVFAAHDDGKTLALCIDEAHPGLNFEGRGQALFGADGEPTAYVQDVLKFVQEYRTQLLRTHAFGKRLDEFGLLQPMQAEFEVTGAQALKLGGFLAIERERLKSLSGPRLQEMLKSDELELLFLHLQSLRNFSRLRERLQPTLSPQGAVADAPAGPVQDLAA